MRWRSQPDFTPDQATDEVRFRALVESHYGAIKSAIQEGAPVSPGILAIYEEMEAEKSEGMQDSPEVPVFAPETEVLNPAATELVTDPDSLDFPPQKLWLLENPGISRKIGQRVAEVYDKPVVPDLRIA